MPVSRDGRATCGAVFMLKDEATGDEIGVGCSKRVDHGGGLHAFNGDYCIITWADMGAVAGVYADGTKVKIVYETING